MARARHPQQDIEMALRYAEWQGWRIEVGGGHGWGRLYCPYNSEVCGCGEFLYHQRVAHAEEPRVPCAGVVPGD